MLVVRQLGHYTCSRTTWSFSSHNPSKLFMSIDSATLPPEWRLLLKISPFRQGLAFEPTSRIVDPGWLLTMIRAPIRVRDCVLASNSKLVIANKRTLFPVVARAEIPREFFITPLRTACLLGRTRLSFTRGFCAVWWPAESMPAHSLPLPAAVQWQFGALPVTTCTCTRRWLLPGANSLDRPLWLPSLAHGTPFSVSLAGSRVRRPGCTYAGMSLAALGPPSATAATWAQGSDQIQFGPQ